MVCGCVEEEREGGEGDGEGVMEGVAEDDDWVGCCVTRVTAAVVVGEGWSEGDEEGMVDDEAGIVGVTELE